MSVPNFSSLACLEVPEKFVWVGGVCTVIFMSNPTVVLRFVGVGVLTIHICENVVQSKVLVSLPNCCVPGRYLHSGLQLNQANTWQRLSTIIHDYYNSYYKSFLS